MFRAVTPIVRALLIVNIIVFVLERFTNLGGTLLWLFALWPPGASAHYADAAPFQPWQVVTYAFLHDPGGYLHIASNMFALYMFGPDCEQVLGPRRFTLYYFVCVIGAAVTQLLMVGLLHPQPVPTLGASGGIFGLLLLFGMAFPHRKLLLLFFPIPIAAWLFVTLYGVFELLNGVFGTMEGVAHFAHLGGMAAGFLLILYWRRGRLR